MPPATDDAALRAAERAENFPVAMRLLPARLRRHLLAVYDVARVIDDLGDRAPGDRTAALHAYRVDLARVFSDGQPVAPELRRLVPTVRECGLVATPFEDLLQANLVDQQVTRYASWEALQGYCRLSADPIGRLVLAIVYACARRPPPTAPMLTASDQVCRALQVLEHCQDVGEDAAAGRVYLPQQDLAAAGVTEADLQATVTTAALRSVVGRQVDRAAAQLADGTPLVRRLRGWGRVAVAGYLAGGLATVEALRRHDHDVLAIAVRPRRVDVVRHVAMLLAGRP